MKKMIACLFVLAAMVVANTGFGAELNEGSLTIENVTTNAVTLDSGTIDVSGELKTIVIDVTNADPFDLDITDAFTGAVVYSADDVAADVTLLPRLALTGTAGTALTAANEGATNTLYGPVSVLGMNVTAGAATAGTNSVTIKVIVDKNP